MERALAALICFFLLLAPRLAAAATEEMDYGLTGAALKMIGVLAVILGLLIGGLYLLRRFLPGTSKMGWMSGQVRLVGQFPIGPKKLLALVKVADQVLLLGVTEHNISFLTRIDDPQAIEGIARTDERAPLGFAGLLRRVSRGQERGS